jgi:hypothetical protein
MVKKNTKIGLFALLVVIILGIGQNPPCGHKYYKKYIAGHNGTIKNTDDFYTTFYLCSRNDYISDERM